MTTDTDAEVLTLAREILADCEKATPGPWTVERQDEDSGEIYWALHAVRGYEWIANLPENKANAEYIASANPATVAIIARALTSATQRVAELTRERDLAQEKYLTTSTAYVRFREAFGDAYENFEGTEVEFAGHLIETIGEAEAQRDDWKQRHGAVTEEYTLARKLIMERVDDIERLEAQVAVLVDALGDETRLRGVFEETGVTFTAASYCASVVRKILRDLLKAALLSRAEAGQDKGGG